MKNQIRTTAILSLMLTGCIGPKASNTSTGSVASSNQQYIQAKVALTISQSGTPVYSDSNSNNSLSLTAGQTYDFNLDVQNAPSGTAYSLVMTQQGPNNTTTSTMTVPLTAGDNSITVRGGTPNGAYNPTWYWKLTLSATGYQSETRGYTAQVLCPNSNFPAVALDPSIIAVSSGSGANLYNYSAAVPGGAGGTPPYYCAWDLTGTGILDTGFSDCSQALNNQYVNYVSNRNIGLLVQDSCGNSASVASVQDLTYTEPTMPGNVFIFGTTSNPTGEAATDPRETGPSNTGLTYLATNENSVGEDIVQPNYQQSTNGQANGTFSIEASQNYGMSSSVGFGVSITLQGFQDNLNPDPNSGTVNASATINTTAVTVKSVTYVTDQSANPPMPTQRFNSSACTLTNLQATVKDPGGEPCTSGNTADYQAPTVEVSGHVSCTGMQDSSGSTIDYAGDFDGYVLIVDNCTGGGQGGGGVVPISL